MDILVIGGTKFLGYHFTRRFLEEGHKVTLFNRGLSPDDFGDRVNRIQGDRNDHKEFQERLCGQWYDVVLDMIAYNAEDIANAVEILTVLSCVSP